MGLRRWFVGLIDEDLQNASDPGLAARKTWRYQRLAMVAMVIGLAAAILYEHAQTKDGCWQGSISAYYYTPVQGFLVGALVSIGVCLFTLKGNTDLEDALLNLAGVCAPFVALVPTPNRGTCGSMLFGKSTRNALIDNNVFALLVVLSLALVAVAVLEAVNQRNDPEAPPTLVEGISFGLATVALVAAWVLYLAATPWFTRNFHNIAAITMFVFIFLNVLLNARHLQATRRAAGRRIRGVNPYTVIGWLMFLAAVGNAGLAATGWNYWVLSIEACLIVLFGVFWVIQTVELWNDGLRPPLGVSTPPGGQAPVPAQV